MWLQFYDQKFFRFVKQCKQFCFVESSVILYLSQCPLHFGYPFYFWWLFHLLMAIMLGVVSNIGLAEHIDILFQGSNKFFLLLISHDFVVICSFSFY